MKDQTRIFFVDAEPEDVNHSVGYLKKLFNNRTEDPFTTLQKDVMETVKNMMTTVEKDIVVNHRNITKFEAL